MLIPIGFFGGGSLPGAMELISTQTVGATGSVTFSGIPQDFKHIKLVWNGNESTSTNNWAFLVVNLNGNFGQSYNGNSTVWAQGGSGVQAEDSTYSSNINYAIFKNAIRAANSNVTGPQWTYGELWMPNYSSSAFDRRTIAVRGGIGARNSAFMNYRGGASYTSGAAVSSITLRLRTDEFAYNNFGTWQSGSSFTLFGYRG
jgi:hypothetical protein